ncbi:MAG: DnaK suppressor protein [Candidatus Latescibacterota bacterium]|jgi:DnaK suppressor protein
MTQLNQKFSEYQKLLVDRKKLLLKQVFDGDANIGKLGGDRLADFLDVAGMATALELRSTLGSNERRELEEIDHALEKIRNNSYGKCELCEEEIVPARLEAIPTAKLCRDCKSQEENKPLERNVIKKARKLAGEESITAFSDDDDENKNVSVGRTVEAEETEE